MENRFFASYYSRRSLAIDPKRWVRGRRRNGEDSRVPTAQSTLSETPVEEAKFGVLNVTGCAWEGLKTVTLSIAGVVRSEDGVVDLSSWLLTYVVARGGHRST
jgi:hypothetical protein